MRQYSGRSPQTLVCSTSYNPLHQMYATVRAISFPRAGASAVALALSDNALFHIADNDDTRHESEGCQAEADKPCPKQEHARDLPVPPPRDPPAVELDHKTIIFKLFRERTSL